MKITDVDNDQLVYKGTCSPAAPVRTFEISTAGENHGLRYHCYRGWKSFEPISSPGPREKALGLGLFKPNCLALSLT